MDEDLKMKKWSWRYGLRKCNLSFERESNVNLQSEILVQLVLEYTVHNIRVLLSNLVLVTKRLVEGNR